MAVLPVNHLRLNGVHLGRFTLTSGSFYRPPVSVRRTTVVLPAVHGALPVGLPVYDEPNVGLEFRVGGVSTDVELEGLTAELTALLGQPGLTLERDVAGSVQSAEVALVTVIPGEFLWGVYAEYEATLAIPGVFLRDPAPTNTPVLAAGTHDLDTWQDTAPISDAVVRFNTGGVLNVAVVDTTSGTGLSWNGTAPVPSNHYLYLDAGTLRAWSSTSASAWTPAGTDQSQFLDYPGPGPLQLWPRVVHSPTTGTYARERRVTITGGTCVIRARGAHL